MLIAYASTISRLASRQMMWDPSIGKVDVAVKVRLLLMSRPVILVIVALNTSHPRVSPTVLLAATMVMLLAEGHNRSKAEPIQ